MKTTKIVSFTRILMIVCILYIINNHTYAEETTLYEPNTALTSDYTEDIIVDETTNEDPTTWVDTWAEDYKPTALAIWNEYVTDPLLLDEDAYSNLDTLTFERYENSEIINWE